MHTKLTDTFILLKTGKEQKSQNTQFVKVDEERLFLYITAWSTKNCVLGNLETFS